MRETEAEQGATAKAYPRYGEAAERGSADGIAHRSRPDALVSGPVRDAVLLAAGRGTRLGALTERFPKPMLEVAGRPIIEHILAGLRGAGIHRVTIVSGHRAEVLERGIGDGSAVGLRVGYVRQRDPDGTARALSLARPQLPGAAFFFGWGDILVPPRNYRAVLEAAVPPAVAALAVNPVDDPCQGAAVYVDPRWMIQRIVEKPPRGSSSTSWNNAGFGVLPPQIWPLVDQLRPSCRGEYELPQAIAALVQDQPVRAVPVQGRWFDIGTPADLELARERYRGD